MENDKKYTVGEWCRLMEKQLYKQGHSQQSTFARAYGSLQGFFEAAMSYGSSLEQIQQSLNNRCQELEAELAKEGAE